MGYSQGNPVQRRVIMPKVGKKKFPYTEAGMKKAAAAKKKHEKTEGSKERMMEYGKKKAKKK
jgi:hypothetical protein